jgi:hypothetical protein
MSGWGEKKNGSLFREGEKGQSLPFPQVAASYEETGKSPFGKRSHYLSLAHHYRAVLGWAPQDLQQ